MKKSIIIGISAMALSFVLLIAFIIGGVTKIQTGPAATVENLEKAINRGNWEKALGYFGIEDTYYFSMYDVPYYNQSINLIPGEVQEVEGEPNCVKMQMGIVTQDGDTVEYNVETITLWKYDNQWVIEMF